MVAKVYDISQKRKETPKAYRARLIDERDTLVDLFHTAERHLDGRLTRPNRTAVQSRHLQIIETISSYNQRIDRLPEPDTIAA